MTPVVGDAARRRPRGSVEFRLWRRVERGGPDECWPWMGYRGPQGHGQIGTGGRYGPTTAAHRVAWASVNGPIPDGVVIRHTCDNPPCCNPAHLVSGTLADNNRDMVERGRQAQGFRLPQTKLSDEDVQFIRDNYQHGWRWTNAHELAAKFGIQRGHVCAIARGAKRANS